MEQDRYDIASLKANNETYDDKHTVTQEDVELANRHIQLIESTRSNTEVKVGDIIQFTTKHGNYYPTAHVDKVNQKEYYVCEQPMVSFIGATVGGIYCDTGGGAWHRVPLVRLKYVGSQSKQFKDWGHCGVCAYGGVYFEANVSVWEYAEPESDNGEFRTKSLDNTSQ